MTHPEDLLADYVDGALTDAERAVVDAHLATCQTCREEVAAAGVAIAALATLEQEPVPLGVTAPVLAEARRSVERRRPVWARLQWAAGVAAAACLVLLAVVALPRLGSDDGQESSLRAPAAEAEDQATGGAALQAAPQLEIVDEDLDERDLRRLARETAKLVPELPAAEFASGAPPDDAIACLVASGATMDDQDVLVRIIQGTYLGTPATIGVFHEGPGGGRPPERVVVWVVGTADCAILTLLSQNV
jgi:anti-sigma factor RsiW